MDNGQAGEDTMMDDGWGEQEKTEIQENIYWNSNLAVEYVSGSEK